MSYFIEIIESDIAKYMFCDAREFIFRLEEESYISDWLRINAAQLTQNCSQSDRSAFGVRKYRRRQFCGRSDPQ